MTLWKVGTKERVYLRKQGMRVHMDGALNRLEQRRRRHALEEFPPRGRCGVAIIA